MESTQKINKMGVKPINKLLLSMGIPMIISMMLQAFYNIVDSLFVSGMPDTATLTHVGEYGVNALTLAFPIQMLMVSIGVGTGVGVNALLSKNLGQGNREKASLIAGNAVFLGICTYIVFLIFGLVGVDAFMATQTSDPVVLQMGKDYLSICCIWSFGTIVYLIYEKLLQSTGRSIQSTIAQIAGALSNIILDPIMIYGLLGFPALGIKGAAYATVIGQGIALVVGFVLHTHYNKRDLNTSLSYIRPNLKAMKEIYSIGIPAIIMQSLTSFMTYGINIIFGTISSSVVTAYGVYFKIQQFILFAAFGMNNAIIPIVGFNYGMRDKKRINDGIRYGMLYTLIIMGIGMILLQLGAYQITDIFSLSDSTKALCVTAIRIITLSYLFAGANVVYQGVFQSLGYGVHSLIISLIRMIIAALPLAYLFTLFANAENTVWLAFPISEALGFIAASLFMRKIKKEKLACM